MKRKDKQKKLTFRQLVFDSLFEMTGLQLVSSVILYALTRVLGRGAQYLISMRTDALTTSNAKQVLLSWQGLVLLLFGAVIILGYITLELFPQLFLSDDILNGRPSSIRRNLLKGLLSVRKFGTTAGVLILLYIAAAFPLAGLGFSISLTKNLYIPSFIMSVVWSTPLYTALYVGGVAVLLVLGFLWLFSLHGILLKDLAPFEAFGYSSGLMKRHWAEFLKVMARTFLFVILLQVINDGVLIPLATGILDHVYSDLPVNTVLPSLAELLAMDELPELYGRTLAYRILSSFLLIEGQYLSAFIDFISSGYVMLAFTHCFVSFARQEEGQEPLQLVERPKRAGYFRIVFSQLAIAIVLLGLSIVVGLAIDEFRRTEPVELIAHRCGGTMASENSIPGLYAAIEHGCYGSETDVQRTKDGYYIINHDDTFKRLAGVNKAPQEMTLEEIRELQIPDTTGSGEVLTVPTIEEFLDVTVGKEKLFIELKGKTADRQMADDLVQLIRERDCVDDVVLISLKYDVIDYIETTYPEFETGLLFFAGIGDLTRLHCDIMIMEEEMSTQARISELHVAGKKVMVWTVNTRDQLHEFLDRDIDGIITDEILLAEEVQTELDARTDQQFIADLLEDTFQ